MARRRITQWRMRRRVGRVFENRDSGDCGPVAISIYLVFPISFLSTNFHQNTRGGVEARRDGSTAANSSPQASRGTWATTSSVATAVPNTGLATGRLAGRCVSGVGRISIPTLAICHQRRVCSTAARSRAASAEQLSLSAGLAAVATVAILY